MTRVFGLRVQAAFPLPELQDPAQPASDGPALRMRRQVGIADAPLGWSRTASGAIYGHASPSGQRVQVQVGPEELILRGPAEVEPALVRLLALGPGLAGWLTLAGVPVLHGNVARVGERDVAITGPGGVGKSTLTGALLGRGARLVADDLAVLDGLEQGAPRVRPGFGRLKLWEDAAQHLGHDPGALPRVHPEHRKRGLPAPVVGSAGPLGAVVILRRGPAGLRTLGGAEALQGLLVNPRVPELLDGPGQARWMQAVARLIRVVPVFELGLPGPLAALDAAAAAVERALADPQLP